MVKMRTSISRVILCILALVAPTFARSPELTTQGLEQRIDFWKKVYTQYGKDDLIIHDRVYVNLIYAVASDENADAKVREIKSALSEIRTNPGTPDTFSPLVGQIYAAMVQQSIPTTPDVLDDLLADVHTQRGVKERFRE